MKTTEQSELLKDIIADPDNNTLRLIYADCCEDNQDPERAEFIRVQVEMARMCEDGVPKSLAAFTALRQRQDELLETSHEISLLSGQAIRNRMIWMPDWKHYCADTIWQYTRGFVGEVRCSMSELLDQAGKLFDSCPVSSVIILNAVPTWRGFGEPRNYTGWFVRTAREWCSADDGVPPEIGAHLDGFEHANEWIWYRSIQEAEEALQRACVRYGLSKSTIKRKA